MIVYDRRRTFDFHTDVYAFDKRIEYDALLREERETILCGRRGCHSSDILRRRIGRKQMKTLKVD